MIAAMLRRVASISSRVSALSVLVLFASVSGAQPPKKSVTNTDVVNMTKAGLSDEVTIAAIQGATVDFDTSADALVGLKRQGVTDRVIAAMLKARSQGVSPTTGTMITSGTTTATGTGTSNGNATTTKGNAATDGVVPTRTAIKTIERGALDHIELFIETIEQPAGVTLVMKPFDASAADLGTGRKDGKEARQQEALTMQNEGPRVLAERFVATLEKLGSFKSVRALKADEAVPDGAMVVEGKFVTIDPGSRAKRYFAGFGAGKSSVAVSGTVKDSAGRTVATFEQRRIGTMGVYGGDSLGKLMSDTRSIGEDIGQFLAKWARGQNLK